MILRKNIDSTFSIIRKYLSVDEKMGLPTMGQILEE